MTLREGAPKTDESTNEKAKRSFLVERFRNTVNMQVEQLGEGTISADVKAGKFSMRFLLPNPWHLNESFAIKQPANINGASLVSAFEPIKDRDGKPEISRQSILIRDQEKVSDIGLRVLSPMEMDDLLQLMEDPEGNAGLIEELVESTAEERKKIDRQLSLMKWEDEMLTQSVQERIRQVNNRTLGKNH